MKCFKLTLLALVCAGAASCSSTSNSAGPMDEQAMMEKWMKYSSPGEAHQVLAHKVGNWKLRVRMFNPDGSLGGESDATSAIQSIMEGRFIEDHTTDSFQGMPFLGHGMSGFDNIKQRYVGTWVDNMSTGVMNYEGTYDSATKTIHSTGESPDPMTWQYVGTRSTETFVDDDHMVMKSFMKGPDGKEYMMMQLDYTRTSR
ncbi:MAG: DUF1579 domain-containing protein [Planctomycetes bacterium]|nr:DUF1579 domain-containing protein [Planctomycetota bacterium]